MRQIMPPLQEVKKRPDLRRSRMIRGVEVDKAQHPATVYVLRPRNVFRELQHSPELIDQKSLIYTTGRNLGSGANRVDDTSLG
jgi:hypothetical protein